MIALTPAPPRSHFARRATRDVTARRGEHSKTHGGERRLQQPGLRFYSSELGRWVNRDPIGEMGGLNVNAFLRNGTLFFVDADGRGLTVPWDPDPSPIDDPFPGYFDPFVPYDMPSPTLSTVGRSCNCCSGLAEAISLANLAMKQGKCRAWFQARNPPQTRGVDYKVKCKGRGALADNIHEFWTFPYRSRVWVSKSKVCRKNLTVIYMAELLIHEAAHHYCPYLGSLPISDRCPVSAQNACRDELLMIADRSRKRAKLPRGLCKRSCLTTPAASP
jgi:RHS repeat-associated protein